MSGRPGIDLSFGLNRKPSVRMARWTFNSGPVFVERTFAIRALLFARESLSVLLAGGTTRSDSYDRSQSPVSTDSGGGPHSPVDLRPSASGTAQVTSFGS